MSCFCLNVTATTEIYTYGHTLSLHDALPSSRPTRPTTRSRIDREPRVALAAADERLDHPRQTRGARLDPGGRRGQARVPRSRAWQGQDGPRRDARPARIGRAADRAWRGDQADRPYARREQGL